MSEINNVLGVSGAGQALETSDARRWFFCALTKTAQARFESWLEEKTWARVARAKAHLAPDDYAQLVDHTQEKIDRGEYAPFSGQFDASGNPVVNDKLKAAVATPQGMVFFIRLHLEAKQPNVTTEDAEYILTDQPERVALMLRALYPKAGAPAGKAAPAGA